MFLEDETGMIVATVFVKGASKRGENWESIGTGGSLRAIEEIYPLDKFLKI